MQDGLMIRLFCYEKLDMILDQLDNALLYGGLGKRISIGLALLGEESVRDAAPGKYEVDSGNLFYIVDEYETKPLEDGRLEIHRKYMDIQYIVSGCECIGTAPLAGLTEQTPYDGEKDLAFYDAAPDMSKLVLKPGMFAIFWPNEPHMPGRTVEKCESVKKLMIKI
ncbi:MAG: YhcH/YjgK/YiaL family protein, partial [Planctomycetes bacterium]|nr:YhcH/YjgK/YiaL family protein [Planctomycetota bacterium]